MRALSACGQILHKNPGKGQTPPHSGNACILGLSGQATPPLAEDDDDEDGEDYSDDDDDQANDEDGEVYSDDDAHYGVMIMTLEYIFPTELIN